MKEPEPDPPRVPKIVYQWGNEFEHLVQKLEAMLAQRPFLRWDPKQKKKFAKALCVWKVLGPLPLRTLI